MTTQYESLTVSRLIAATPLRLFEAWTTPDLIVQWWGAGPIICTEAHVDLTAGGSYRIANSTPDGQLMWITGTFKVIDPPRELAYTWAVEPISSETDISDVRVTFETQGPGTLVTVTHTRIPNAEAHETNLAGWQGCLAGLDALFPQ